MPYNILCKHSLQLKHSNLGKATGIKIKGVDTMATTNITMRMDENLKSQAEELFNNLGMNMTTAFTIFLKQAVREQRIPFSISMDIPNAETIRAIEDLRKRNNLSRSFSSVNELMEDLNNGN